MVLTKRRKRDGDDADELEHEALAEWLSRGLATSDFTMDKMLKLWTEEDDAGDDVDALTDKQELIASFNVFGSTLKHTKDIASDFRDTAIHEAKHLWTTAKRIAEIPPLRRRRLLREHVRDVWCMDADATKYARIQQRFADEHAAADREQSALAFGLLARNRGRAPLLARARELTRDADREQLVQQRDERERLRRDRIDNERRAQQLASDTRDQDAAEQLAATRRLSATYWQRQLADARAFAAQQQQQRDAQVADDNQQVADTLNDGDNDDVAVDGTPLSSSRRGVFATAFAPGEWHSAVDGGDRNGLDAHTVALATTRAFDAEHEETRNALLETQSRVRMFEQKLAQVASVRATLAHDRRTLLQIKNAVLTDVKHLADEHDALSRELAGPPRRDATEHDKQQFHALVTRRAAHKQQLATFDVRLANLHRREQLAVQAESTFGPQLDAARSRAAQLETQVDAFDAQRQDLPVVIGHSIFKAVGAGAGVGANGDELQAATASLSAGDVDIVTDAASSETAQHRDPTALLTHVTMQSKLALLEHAARPAIAHARAAPRLAAERYQWAERKALAQHELNETTTRLADVRDRFIEAQRASLRVDLMHAIVRFHQSGTKLRKSIFPVRGAIDWWQQRAPRTSYCIDSSERLGVLHLEPPHTRGQLRGCVRLPKRCGYRVQLTIRLQRLTDDDSSSEHESAHDSDGDDTNGNDDAAQRSTATRSVRDVKVFIGSDYDALQELAFRDPGGKVLRTGELAFEYFGNRLCYCFEFSLRNELAWREPLQLVVSHTGTFEEQLEDFRDEEQRARQLQQRETHFVSELVKTLRLQSKQTSSERCTDLLQELLAVERSRAKTWDSVLLHGHTQRFRRSEYAQMLRLEIKKEVTRQIDDDVHARRARGIVDRADSDNSSSSSDAVTSGSRQLTRSDVSRVDFLARKCALVEPQLLRAKDALGDYCSFKTAASESELQTPPPPTSRRESMVLGLRCEWREGKSKLHVLHKLCTASLATTEASVSPSSSSHTEPLSLNTSSAVTTVDAWRAIESANAVFIASAFTQALQSHRRDAAAARALECAMLTQLVELQRETQQTLQDDAAAVERERREDAALQKRKADDLARRRRKLYTDAMRLTTYNASVAMQIDERVQRQLLARAQRNSDDDDGISGRHGAATTDPAAVADVVRRDVKQRFASQFVDGRVALAAKTWARKETRLADDRVRARRERMFSIEHEATRAAAITDSAVLAQTQLQMAQSQAQSLESQLAIPYFDRAVHGAFACEHRNVKAWGSAYGVGSRCKQCGKEMAMSFDDPDAARGADPSLDRDVQQQRAAEAGGPALRFATSTHRRRVEDERVRLEKEARALALSDGVLYDRKHPKAIDALNFRHGLDRGVAITVDGADPLYARVVHDLHRAAFQDTVLFHGRLRNFDVRLRQLDDLHTTTITLLAVQRDFLEHVAIENAFVLEQLPLVERDHARAVQLLAEDTAALQQLEAAKRKRVAAQKECEAARHATEGVEDDAAFAECHVPALVASSDEMQTIVTRVAAAHTVTAREVAQCDAELQAACAARVATAGLLERLQLRAPNTRVRTRLGFARVEYVRDTDAVAVLTLSAWSATLYVRVESLVALEALYREGESVAMAREERMTRAFETAERSRESAECALMAFEDAAIATITAWHRVHVTHCERVSAALEREELAQQLAYERMGRLQTADAAAREAKQLYAVGRVSLKRRAMVHGPSRLDVLRVTRACEKRLAMAAVETALVGVDVGLRRDFARERDVHYANTLSAQVLDELQCELMAEIGAAALAEAADASHALETSLSSAIVSLARADAHDVGANDAWSAVLTHVQLGFDRLWTARRVKYELLQRTWQREAAKLALLQHELASRAELKRLAALERAALEAQQRAMFAEERRCRQFYIDEAALCMRERKAMAQSELEMREFVRQLEAEALKAKYAKMVDDRSAHLTSDKAARRLEIKVGKAEKHRLHREWAAIVREDALATELRDGDRARAQAEALEQQLDRYLLQQALDGSVAAALEASRLQDRVREAQRLAVAERQAVEAERKQANMTATVTTFAAVAAAEVAYMRAVERAVYALQQLTPLDAKLRALTPELERIQHERTHVVADAERKRAIANACHTRLEHATAALTAAAHVEDTSASKYARVHAANATIDSDVLHGRPQRFRTEYLRATLHTQYFRLLTESIVRRAVVVATEREVTRLEIRRDALLSERIVKRADVARLKRKHRRAYHLSLRRAELGALLFGRTQQRIKRMRFDQWVALSSQRVRVRAAFELKHSLILQQQRLQATTTTPAVAVPTLETTTRMAPTLIRPLSVMHDHQKRLQVCRLCKREYSEAQNHKLACTYHPEPYALACVRTCASRQSTTGAVTATCMLHRARRWLCCDATDEGRFGSNGCARRWHMPTRTNPALATLVAAKTETEATLVAQLDQQLLELRERDVVGHVQRATKAVVSKIERELADKRAVAAKYHTLDRR